MLRPCHSSLLWIGRCPSGKPHEARPILLSVDGQVHEVASVPVPEFVSVNWRSAEEPTTTVDGAEAMTLEHVHEALAFRLCDGATKS